MFLGAMSGLLMSTGDFPQLTGSSHCSSVWDIWHYWSKIIVCQSGKQVSKLLSLPIAKDKIMLTSSQKNSIVASMLYFPKYFDPIQVKITVIRLWKPQIVITLNSLQRQFAQCAAGRGETDIHPGLLFSEV